MAIQLLLEGPQDGQREELDLSDAAFPALIGNLHLDLDQSVGRHESNVLRHVQHDMQVVNKGHQILFVLNHQVK